MRLNDKILYKYFLSDDYYQAIVEAAEKEKSALLDEAYPHTVYTELGLATAGQSVEEIVIELAEIDERICRLKNSINKTKAILQKAIKKINKRESIILFTYFRTGIVLTNNKELFKAQEKMIDILEDIKNKEDRLLKQRYLKDLSIKKQKEGVKDGKRVFKRVYNR